MLTSLVRESLSGEFGEPIPANAVSAKLRRPVWRPWGYYVRFDRPAPPSSTSKGKTQRKSAQPVLVAVVCSSSVTRKLAMSWKWEFATGTRLRGAAYMRETLTAPAVLAGLIVMCAGMTVVPWWCAVLAGAVIGALVCVLGVVVFWRCADDVFGTASTHDAVHVVMTDGDESAVTRAVLRLDRKAQAFVRGGLERTVFESERAVTFAELVALTAA